MFPLAKSISVPHYECKGLFIIILARYYLIIIYGTLLFQLYKSDTCDGAYIAGINEVCQGNMGAFPLKVSECNAAKKA